MGPTPEATHAREDAGRSPAVFTKLPPGPGRPAAQVAQNQSARIRAAMIELVAQRGYRSVNVRALVGLAGVSTRTFYERFASKEDCFRQTYDAIVRRAIERIVLPLSDVSDLRGRQRQIIAAFAREVEADPKASRLALIDAPSTGSAMLEHVRRVERGVEARLADALAEAPGGVVLPSLVIEGMTAGILGVVRAKLQAQQRPVFDGLQDELGEWMFSYTTDLATVLPDLDGKSVWRNTALEPLSRSPRERRGLGDRSRILSAVGDLTKSHGYSRLAISDICARADVPRRKFGAHFASVEDCFLACLESRCDEAIAQIARAKRASQTPSGGLYRAIVALCEHMDADTLLAKVCLREDFAPGHRIEHFRARAIDLLNTQLLDHATYNGVRSTPTFEATANAVSALVRRHVIDKTAENRIAASLAYVALAPTAGAPNALAAIAEEQSYCQSI